MSQKNALPTRRRFLSTALLGAAAAAAAPLLARAQSDPNRQPERKPDMIKMTMFLKRNPKLTHEQFVDHHLNHHGPLFRSIPEAKIHVIRYLQTHPIAEKSKVIAVNDFDGTAELWFDSVAGLDAVLTSETYKTTVFPDELTFLDHKNTLVQLGTQADIMGGAGSA
ncbi:MAG TPA: EthD domain-containing protein [Chthoniobacterales bacterium]